MKKNIKSILIIGIILILGAISIVWVADLDKKPNPNPNIDKTVCNDINSNIDSNKDFLVYVSAINTEEGIDKLFSKYNELKVLEYNPSIIGEECFQGILKDNGLDDAISGNEAMISMVYKNGKYKAFQIGYPSYDVLEEFLNQQGLIEKKQIIETTNLNQVIENIKNEYILFMFITEDYRDIIKEKASKYTTGINYELINIKSPVGNKIYNYIKKKYEIGNEFPRALYFKNSKLLKQSEIFDIDEEYKLFFDEIKQLQ